MNNKSQALRKKGLILVKAKAAMRKRSLSVDKISVNTSLKRLED